jgi:hypothetical protein
MSLLPSGFFDTVVSIEIEKEGAGFISVATGFLAGFLIGKNDSEGKPLYQIFLVTNRHVFEKFSEVFLRFNK